MLALDAKSYRTINRASLYHQQHCVWHDNLYSFHPLAYRKLANSLELARCCRFALYWYRLQLVGVLLWNKGINSVDSNLAGILVSLEPVFAIILAVLLLGENISPLSWLGILAVIATTLISSVYPRLIRRVS